MIITNVGVWAHLVVAALCVTERPPCIGVEGMHLFRRSEAPQTMHPQRLQLRISAGVACGRHFCVSAGDADGCLQPHHLFVRETTQRQAAQVMAKRARALHTSFTTSFAISLKCCRSRRCANGMLTSNSTLEESGVFACTRSIFNCASGVRKATRLLPCPEHIMTNNGIGLPRASGSGTRSRCWQHCCGPKHRG